MLERAVKKLSVFVAGHSKGNEVYIFFDVVMSPARSRRATGRALAKVRVMNVCHGCTDAGGGGGSTTTRGASRVFLENIYL